MAEYRPWAQAPELLSEVLSDDELIALYALSGICDARRFSDFWENVVARVLSGEVTPHQCPWDISLIGVRIEVKFSTSFTCRFSSGSRKVFKFASLTGAGCAHKECDVLVLIGYDAPHVYCWVIPYGNAIRKTATISVPSVRNSRLGSSPQALFDKYASCLTQLLPDVLEACPHRYEHLRHDARQHADSARVTRRRKSPQVDLEDWLAGV